MKQKIKMLGKQVLTYLKTKIDPNIIYNVEEKANGFNINKEIKMPTSVWTKAQSEDLDIRFQDVNTKIEKVQSEIQEVRTEVKEVKKELNDKFNIIIDILARNGMK